MRFLQTIAVAFSMYSAIPMIQFKWNEKNMRYALCFFPLIGLIIGLLLCGINSLSDYFNFPELLKGAIFCFIPPFITGGIHLDGYCDTNDALASHGSIEKKQEILKDPHIGSFAVIRICLYFLISFSLWATLPHFKCIPILSIYCISRCLSGLSVCSFPLSKNTGLAYTFSSKANKKITIFFLLAILILNSSLLLIFEKMTGLLMIILAILMFLYYRHIAVKQFGGLSGDLAGWFLQKLEFWMLVVLYASEIGGILK